MANSISHASIPYPIKNARFSVVIPYLDADGDPTDPTTPDTELSGDAGSFADAAEEATTITGSNGVAYITLTGAETNYSAVVLAAKVASGPKATLMLISPRNLAIVGSGTLSAGSAGGGTLGTILAYDLTGCFIRTTGGTGGGGTGGANNQARRIITYTISTGAFTVSPNWETTPSTDTTYDILLPEGVTLGMLRALNPTTAGRTLDVSSGGEAGLDWSNIGSPTTSQTLSGTTVGTATVAGTVNALAAGVITAASIANDAITAAKVAADVTTEIQSGLATAAALDAVDNFLDTEIADIQARLPAALVSGRMDASVGAMAANVMTAAAAAADLTTELQSGLATAANLATVAGYIDTEIADIQSRLPAALVSGRIDASVGAMAANVVTAAAIADAAIDRATFAVDTGLLTIRSNTAQAGASGSITLDASASSVNDFYLNDLIFLTGGTGAGQARYITGYNGTTKVATVSTWATTPDSTTTFAVLPGDAIPGATAPTAAAIRAEMDSNSTQLAKLGTPAGASISADIAALQTDTNDIQTRLPAALVSGRMDASVEAMANNVLTAAAINADAITAAKLAADVATELQSGLATAASLATVAGYLDTEIAAIKAVTDLLPNGGALSSLATQASVNAVDDFLDTEIAAIKAKTDSLTFTVAGQVDANVQYVNDVQVNGTGALGDEWGP